MIDPVQQLGDAVLLRGTAVLYAHHLVARGVQQAAARDGIYPPATVQQLMQALESAAACIQEARSAAGHPDVPTPADPAISPVEELTTREAADMLHITPRHARRIATSIGGRRQNRDWTFDRGDVAAYAENRKATTTT